MLSVRLITLSVFFCGVCQSTPYTGVASSQALISCTGISSLHRRVAKASLRSWSSAGSLIKGLDF